MSVSARKKLVSTANISQITSSAEMVGKKSETLTIPTAEDLAAQIRRDLLHQIDLAETFRKDHHSNKRYSLARKFNAVARSHSLALTEFDELLDRVPDGFELVPVYYTEVNSTASDAAGREFRNLVKPDFLRHIATHHADELRALGISASGIHEMNQGRMPYKDPYVDRWALGVDHIVERHGAGRWSRDEAEDENNKALFSEVLKVNHFANLILLPEGVHEYKNKLRNVQSFGLEHEGQGKWMLMLTPIRDEKHSGFVCPAQTSYPEVFGFRPNWRGDIVTRIQDIRSDVKEFFKLFDCIVEDPDGLKVMDEFKAAAARQSILTQQSASVANMVGQMGFLPFVQSDAKLQETFNTYAHKLPASEEAIFKKMPPLLEKITQDLLELETDILSTDLTNESNARRYALFQDFVQGYRMGRFRNEVSIMPLKEADLMLKALADVDYNLGLHEEAHGRLDYAALVPGHHLPKPDRLGKAFAQVANNNVTKTPTAKAHTTPKKNSNTPGDKNKKNKNSRSHKKSRPNRHHGRGGRNRGFR